MIGSNKNYNILSKKFNFKIKIGGKKVVKKIRLNMKTCVYLSYKGLGANLLHLAYCHEIARKYGSVTIITLCNNLEAALKDDPLNQKSCFYQQIS